MSDYKVTVGFTSKDDSKYSAGQLVTRGEFDDDKEWKFLIAKKIIVSADTLTPVDKARQQDAERAKSAADKAKVERGFDIDKFDDQLAVAIAFMTQFPEGMEGIKNQLDSLGKRVAELEASQDPELPSETVEKEVEPSPAAVITPKIPVNKPGRPANKKA